MRINVNLSIWNVGRVPSFAFLGSANPSTASGKDSLSGAKQKGSGYPRLRFASVLCGSAYTVASTAKAVSNSRLHNTKYSSYLGSILSLALLILAILPQVLLEIFVYYTNHKVIEKFYFYRINRWI